MLLAAAAAIATWWQFDWYEVRFDVQPPGEEHDWLVTDKRWRSAGWLFEKRAEVFGDGIKSFRWRYSESGKLHGHCYASIWGGDEEDWYYKGQGFERDELGWVRNEWYWYGDRISEGEWHLRNR